MEPGIHIGIVWFDEEVIEWRVRADNGTFAGSADLYVGHDDAARLADMFRGFPESGDARGDLEFGTFDPNYAGGGARFRLRCGDMAAHVELQVELRSDPRGDAGTEESVALVLSIEPAALDRFVAALDGLTVRVGAEAHLTAAG